MDRSDPWGNLQRLLPEFYEATWQTFLMLGISTTVGVLLGGLLGIWLFVTDKSGLFPKIHFNHGLSWVVSFMRAFPFVFLMIEMMEYVRRIPFIGTSYGPLAASVPLSVAASFYFARLVEQNLKEVPKGVIEAATAMGASPLTIIVKVLLNEARSGLVRSITILIISTLSTSSAAGLIGGGGLGYLGIRYGHQRYMPEVMHTVLLALSALVITIQAAGSYLAAKLDKR